MAQPRVALFVTCLVDQLFPRVGLAMAGVLERAGCRVEFPAAQTCCGQPAFNSGWNDEARPVARHFLSTFRGYDYVVSPSGSCVSMVTRHYRELFAHDPALLLESETLARKVFEFSAFLTGVLQAADLDARFPHRVTFHDSCHALRELGIRDAPRRLLQQVRDLELLEMDAAEECCGFGGTFAVKFPSLSAALGRTKLASIERTEADYVVSIDSSCLMQIEGVLRRAGARARAIHLAEVLAGR